MTKQLTTLTALIDSQIETLQSLQAEAEAAIEQLEAYADEHGLTLAAERRLQDD